MIALLVLGPERMLTPSVAVIWVSAAAGAALTVPTSRTAASSVTTAILSRDEKALNLLSFEHHFKSPSRPDRSAQSHQSHKSQKPQLAQDSNGVTSVTARSPVNLFWNFKPTRRLRPDNFTDVIRSGRGSCYARSSAASCPHYARPCERGRCPCSAWDDRRGCCFTLAGQMTLILTWNWAIKDNPPASSTWVRKLVTILAIGCAL